MNIPTLLYEQWVDENGFLTNSVQMYTDLLNQALQNGLSDNGWTVPQQTTAQITAAAQLMPEGTLWICTDATPHCFVGLLNGSLVKFTTTAFP